MNRFLRVLAFLLGAHLTGIAITFLLRLSQFLVCSDMLSDGVSGQTMLQAEAFLRGVWFDNVIGCYILVLPLFASVVCCVFGYSGEWLRKSLCVWLDVLWSLVFLISAANIPYFRYFFKNINSSIWGWAEYGTQTLGMLFGEPSYYPPLVGFVVLVVVFALMNSAMSRKLLAVSDARDSWWKPLLVGLPCIGLCIFGIRGRTGYNPIKVSAAYYCDDPLLNQLGVSPTFNLLTSTLDDFRPENKTLYLMDEAEALSNAAAYYGWNETATDTLSARCESKNLVLILMESMSADLMGVFGNERNLTPFLDSLAHESILFTNFYSSGIHTNNGMFATLYSFPSILGRNMMKGTDIPHYEGLPTELRKRGYRTMFFMTHESQYDNMNAFFRTNGYEEIYSQEDYPADKVVNSFGVQDDFLFDFAVRKINVAPQPFFATLLSISNHPPYVVPAYFHPKSERTEEQIVEYADWSIRQFFEKARHESWYGNTVFVLLGDHGTLVGESECELPQSYNHIPLLLFIPDGEPSENQSFGIQTDVQKTVLDILGYQCAIDNFGINLMKQTRPYAFYCADDIMGVRNADHLYIYKPSEPMELMYLDGRKTEQPDSVFRSMKEYLFSNYQAADAMTNRHRGGGI